MIDPKSKATYVYPSGKKDAKYIIIGEQPGRIEVLNGRPFVGPAGKQLDSILQSSGIIRSDCYFTNVIKDIDRPLGYYIEFRKNKGYLIHEEGREYIELLAKELSECKSSTIITLGNIPLFALTDRSGITRWRGSVIDATLLHGKKVIPTIHPATIIPPKFQSTNRLLLIWDFRRAKKVQEGEWIPKERNIKIRPTFSESLHFLETCKSYGLLGNPISYDIEVDVFNGEMTCISFAYSPTDVMSIPFICERGDYFTIPQEAEILLKIAEILEHPKIPINGQNLCFDCHYMLRKYGIKASNIQDTMVAQKTLLQDYPAGLHFICSLYTDIPYYKDDGKYWLKGIGSWESGWRYNALDSIVCAEAYQKQIDDLIKQGNYYTYLRKCRIIPPLVYLMEHGIRINVESMTREYEMLGEEIERLKLKLNDLCGQKLNPNSPKQIADYFYVKKRLPIYKSKTGGRSTDELALKRIARKGHKEASLILKIRGMAKLRSTFLDPSKIDPDGRMRSSYNPVGTRYSRISSSKNIFGTGNNLQNQPHTVLKHFLADPYHVYFGMDLSQAENRIVAYEGRISQMIDAFESGKDIHGLTARIIINIIYGNEKSKEIDIHNLAPIGNGTRTWRYWGKKANHGLNYDLGYKNFSLINEILEREGKMIVNTYHLAYPGVRQGFHAHVKRCLMKNKTLTNLLGRKTFFAGKLDDKLFKEAYACIPQGTVGDIIDQRGMNYIYYNRSSLFKEVKLTIQIHDQIGFQMPTPYHPTTPLSWENISEILTKIKSSLETPLFTHYGRKFVIPVDTMMGINLYKKDMVDIDDFSPDNLQMNFHKVNNWLPSIVK